MLKVRNLIKKYTEFALNDISFELPAGYIMGFIGRNGAGKTTTIKSILNFTHPDSGNVEILGFDSKTDETKIKEQVGVMLGEFNYYPYSKIKKIVKVYKAFFKDWDNEKYTELLNKFKIDENKTIKQLSTGMRVKLSITLALSHNAKLLIFDEPTSGLDPVAREELLEIFRDVVADGDKSILFSTHITSDLDKCADFIIFIKNGTLVANTTKDDLIDSHVLIAGKTMELTDKIKSKIIGIQTNAFGFTALLKRNDFTPEMEKIFSHEKPNLEDIMVYYDREAK